MSVRARSPDLDWILSAAALVLALACALLLNRPAIPHPVGWEPPTPQAGLLDFEVGEVRRRPAGSLVWYSAEPGDTLFLGDALFVAEGGIAKVRLDEIRGSRTWW